MSRMVAETASLRPMITIVPVVKGSQLFAKKISKSERKLNAGPEITGRTQPTIPASARMNPAMRSAAIPDTAPVPDHH